MRRSNARARSRARQGFAADAIAAARLTVESGAAKVCNIATPRTGLEAKFSLRLTTALALAGRDTASLATYSDVTAQEPAPGAAAGQGDGRLRATAGRTRWRRSRLTLADGRMLEARHDSGIAATDLAAQGRRLEAKFMSLAAPVLSEGRARELADTVASLDRLPSLSALLRLAVPEQKVWR